MRWAAEASGWGEGTRDVGGEGWAPVAAPQRPVTPLLLGSTWAARSRPPRPSPLSSPFELRAKSQPQREAALGSRGRLRPPHAVRLWVELEISPWDWGDASPPPPRRGPGATARRGELPGHGPGEVTGRRALFRVGRRWQGPGEEEAM